MGRKPSEPVSESSETGNDDGRLRLSRPSRRTLLRSAAGAAVVGGGLTATSSAAAATEYEVVLDVVDDLGADPTGGEPINDALAEGVEHDSVKIEFPDGEYVIENGPGGDGFARWDFGDGEEQGRVGELALVGTGDATLRPPSGGRHNILTLWGRDLAIENFTVDQNAHDTSTGITAVGEEKLLLRDIRFDGKVTGDYFETPHWQDPDYDESEIPFDPQCLIPGLLNDDGEGLIENVRAPDGVESLSRKGAVWVNFLHAGDLLFRRCEFSNFSDNAIYGSPPGQGPPLGQDGTVRVENCFFKNNNVTAIRLGTPGSYAKSCTIVTEEGEIPATPWGAVTSRAGWVWYNFDGYYSNIDVVSDDERGVGIYTHPSQSDSFSVSNCRFELNADGTDALRSFTEGGAITARNVSITGVAGEEAPIRVANREVRFDNLCVDQTGADRDGIWLTDATATITESKIDVPGERIVADEDSDVAVRNLREDGDCPPARSHHSLDE